MADTLTLEVDGAVVPVTHPDKLVFPEPGLTKLDLVRYYLAVADGALRGAGGRPMVLKRFPKGIDERAVLPEARAGKPPGLHRHGDAALRVRALGRGGRDPGCRGPGLGGEPWLPRPQPAPGARRGPRAPRRAAGRPRPDAGGRLGADRRRRATSPGRCSTTPASSAWPKTSGSRGLPHLRAHRAAVDVPRRAARRRDPRPRGREPRARPRHRAVVEGGARRERVRRLQPERQGPHRGVGVLGPAAARCPGLDAADVGRGAALPARSSSPCSTVPGAVRRASATRTPGSTTRPARSTALLALADELGPAEKPPRAATAGRRQSTMPLIEVARAKTKPEALAALDEWKARHPDVVPPLQPADVLVDGMRGRARSGTGSG